MTRPLPVFHPSAHAGSGGCALRSAILKVTIRQITLGGRLSIAVAACWSLCVLLALNRGAFGDHFGFAAEVLSFPLGVFFGESGIFVRRGLIQLDEIIALHLLMIPNAFILGYGVAGLYRALRPSNDIKISSISYSDFKSKNKKAEQAAPSNH